MPGDSIWFLLVGGLICSIGALGGIWAERRRLEFVIRDQAARNVEMARRLTEQERTATAMIEDSKALDNFLVVLPDVVRRLNSDMARRGIPPLLVSSLGQLFEGAQILVYITQGKDELVLADGKSLPEGMERGHRIRFGDGPLGFAALHQRVMERDEFQADTNFRRTALDHYEPPGLNVDLAAPMVNEGRTLGVLSVGGNATRHHDSKKMIKLVADLGSLALRNQDHINALQTMANRDSLTNLYTKRFLNLTLGTLIHRAEQTHTPLSVIVFDIDHFKKFNDTFGHLAGDEILKKVAALLKQQLRADDVPARYGGEEFVVVLPNTSKEDAVTTAEKIRAAIESQSFVLSSTPQRSRVTISGGVASYLVDGTSSQEILGAADQALYLAKEQGRNKVVVYQTRYLSDGM